MRKAQHDHACTQIHRILPEHLEDTNRTIAQVLRGVTWLQCLTYLPTQVYLPFD